MHGQTLVAQRFKTQNNKTAVNLSTFRDHQAIRLCDIIILDIRDSVDRTVQGVLTFSGVQTQSSCLAVPIGSSAAKPDDG